MQKDQVWASDARLLLTRFPEPAVEAEYQLWRREVTVPFVRVGMIASLLSWSIYLVTVRLALPEYIAAVLHSVLLFSFPPIVATLVLSFLRRFRGLLMPMTALANCCAGLVIPWHHVGLNLFADDYWVVSTTNIIIMFFAFTIFRMTPAVAIAAVLPYLGVVMWILFAHYRAGSMYEAQVAISLATQSVAFISGLLVCLVLEAVTRRAYVADSTIRAQRNTAQRTREAIQRYIPPAVAARIIAGETSSIDLPQRRRVTVMFSDVVGFTDLADRLDAESLTQIINEYMSAMAEIVEAYGGTLNEFAGDGLMALFGAPNDMPPEKQVHAAAQAAQVMQYRMPLLNEGWFKLGIDEPVRIRIGINTGVLSVGSFGAAGRMTYTAIGMPTNVAARIESKCEPGEVLLSHSSWQLIKDRIPCEPAGSLEIKGVHYPVRIFRMHRPEKDLGAN